MIMGKNCVSCGYECEKEVKIESSQKIEPKKEVVVIGEKDSEFNPVTEMECPKCEHKEAYFWSKQTRSSDEAETKFYKCTKCKYTWRVYR